MPIQPSAADLTVAELQDFHADAPAAWQLTPLIGRLRTISPMAVRYQAPRIIWISRSVQLQACVNGETTWASIRLSSAPLWIGALSVLWPAAAVVLMAALLWMWPPSAPDPSPLVYPPLVTMPAGSSRQFTVRSADSGGQYVVWSATDGLISPAGLFTAPRSAAGRVIITATQKSAPAEAASAVVLAGAELEITPPLAELGPSESTDLAIAGDQASDVEWFATPPGVIVLKGGHVSAPLRIVRAERVVITVKDRRDPARQAGSIVLVSPAGRRDPSFLALVLIMGALGAFLGASRSFANFVGNRTFRASWALFYLFRPVFGAGLAVLVFFGCRAGIVTALSQTTASAPGAAFVSGLTGLFADTVLGKLREVIGALLPTEESRADKMHSTTSIAS